MQRWYLWLPLTAILRERRTEIPLPESVDEMIDHLIFDFDGTISDSYPIFVRIVRQVAKDFDVEVKMSDEELLDKLMVNVKHCMDHMNFQCELYERSQAFWSYQRQYYKEFQAFPEIKPILEKSIPLR